MKGESVIEFILRAHHIFCIQGFRGKGYSEEFVSNMTKIINCLNSNEDIKVKVINHPDYICLGCPKNIGQESMRMFELEKTYNDRGFCEKEDYIVNLDNLVLKVLDIKAEIEYSYKDLLRKIKEKLTEEKFEKICGECQWYGLGYCKEGLLDKNEK